MPVSNTNSGAALYYSLDLGSNWILGIHAALTNPCWLLAKATMTGWLDSDVASNNYYAFPQYASVLVSNNSSVSIYYLYISPSTNASWGADRLGASVILSNNCFTVSNLAPDTYDMKVESPGHSMSITKMGVILTNNALYFWNVTNLN